MFREGKAKKEYNFFTDNTLDSEEVPHSSGLNQIWDMLFPHAHKKSATVLLLGLQLAYCMLTVDWQLLLSPENQRSVWLDLEGLLAYVYLMLMIGSKVEKSLGLTRFLAFVVGFQIIGWISADRGILAHYASMAAIYSFSALSHPNKMEIFDSTGKETYPKIQNTDLLGLSELSLQSSSQRQFRLHNCAGEKIRALETGTSVHRMIDRQQRWFSEIIPKTYKVLVFSFVLFGLVRREEFYGYAVSVTLAVLASKRSEEILVAGVASSAVILCVLWVQKREL